jgi:hypothetical protein
VRNYFSKQCNLTPIKSIPSTDSNILHILLIHYNIQKDNYSNTDQNITKKNKLTKLIIFNFYFILILSSDEEQIFEHRKMYTIMGSKYSLNSSHHTHNIHIHPNKSYLGKNLDTKKILKLILSLKNYLIFYLFIFTYY